MDSYGQDPDAHGTVVRGQINHSSAAKEFLQRRKVSQCYTLIGRKRVPEL
jgi:hypothetical protein